MIILDLLLTVFVYLAFPTLYVCTKGRVTAKKATIMASINAIVCAVLFEIVQLTLFADDPTYIPNLGPAFLYFFISKSILTEKNIEKEVEETKEEKISPLCNTCRYNENNFCKTVNNCKDCPNWKQSQNNPNEYYCRCDEYEQSKMEDCPYYVEFEAELNSSSDIEGMSREKRWQEQEKHDKIVLNGNSAFSDQMLMFCENINIMWETDSNMFSKEMLSETRSKKYLNALTPELFLENYYTFKKGNHDEIKDVIYTERPYLVHESFINMGKYIFETNNQINILNYIIEKDDSEFIKYRSLAKKLLQKEENK